MILRLLAFTLCLLPVFSHAEEENPTLAQLVDATMTPDTLAKTYTMLQKAEAQLSPNCKKPIGGPRPTRVMMFQAPKTTLFSKQLKEGAWMIRYDVQVCEETKQRNVAYEATENGLAMKPVMPGNTLADPMLQNDVVRVLHGLTIKTTPSCQTPMVLDTQMITFPENGDAPWSEIWTTNLCGTYDVRRITFQPNEEGTQFAISAQTAQK